MRQPYDAVMIKIADYVCDYTITSDVALETAQHCLIDSVGCAMLALHFPECTKLLGPWVSGMHIERGARVIGSAQELDPIKAAFDMGTMIRWLDFNDTWLAKEWAHPSDNLGAILSVMDFVSRRSEYGKVYTIRDVLEAMIKAYEIQGGLALENSFNMVGLDHVILVKLASVAVATRLLRGTKEQVVEAISQAWVDGQALRTYRQAPNTGSRKSWAAGDATSRAVRLALLTLSGEEGYRSALTAKHWGFSEVMMKEKPVHLERPLGTYVMENILFKIAYPAEFHAQTAVECAIKLHEKIHAKISGIQKIAITTHNAAMRIINKTGPLYNPADRDHCLQYMVAVALLFGTLTAESYEDAVAADPRIDELRNKMIVVEDDQFSEDYFDEEKRSIANRVDILLDDGTSISETVEYPMGHRRRREEGIPLLWEKFEKNMATRFSDDRVRVLRRTFEDMPALLAMTVPEWMEMLL